MKFLGAASQFVRIHLLESEVDATDVTDEERVPGEDEPIINYKAYVLGCVTRRLDHPDVAVADIDDVTLGKGFEIEPHGCARSHPQACVRPLGEVTRSGGMVSVNVGVDDVSDSKTVPLSDGNVLGWLALGIDDRANAPAGTADQVRSAGPLFVKELPKDHYSPAFP